ncbi:MAG: right-handed parallel beta-helix repeat-containing protein, partial [Candidatus Methanospirareceae archaeon]
MWGKVSPYFLLVLSFFILVGGASAKTIYGHDDYAKVQGAVDNATTEDTIIVRGGAEEITSCITITSPGYYILVDDIVNCSEFHCIQIQSSDVILDGRGHVVSGRDRIGSSGIYVYGPYTNVTIKNLTVTGWDVGIYFRNVENSSILNNTASLNRHGIAIYSSFNITIMNNTVNQNTLDGIAIHSSTNNTVIYNDVRLNNDGIFIDSSENNLIFDNNIISCRTGVNIFHSNNNTIACNGVDLSGDYGIYINYANRNLVIGNNLRLSKWYGACINYGNNNTITLNTISSNDRDGLYLTYSHENTISNNVIAKNSRNGIYMYSSNNNTIFGNEIMDNGENNYGIYLHSSSGNIIYNNYIENKYNVGFGGTSQNKWNITKTLAENIVGGPYLGGNFWATPHGTGFSRSCADTDRDGICDSPYVIAENNTDYLPLAEITKKKIIGAFTNAIKKVADGYVLAGRYEGHLPWIAKIDKFGDVIWSKTYRGCWVLGEFNDIVETEDGYLAVGYMMNLTVVGAPREVFIVREVLIVKTDLNGNESWNVTINIGGEDIWYGEDTALCVERLSDSYVIGGNSFVDVDKDLSADKELLFLLIVDGQGDIERKLVLEKAYQPLGYSYVGAYDIDVTSDGNIIVGGGYRSYLQSTLPPFKWNSTVLFKFDPQLNSIWNLTLPYPAVITSVEETEYGYAAALPYNNSIMKVTHDGSIISIDRLDFAPYDIVKSDDKLVVAGKKYHRTYYGRKYWRGVVQAISENETDWSVDAGNIDFFGDMSDGHIGTNVVAFNAFRHKKEVIIPPPIPPTLIRGERRAPMERGGEIRGSSIIVVGHGYQTLLYFISSDGFILTPYCTIQTSYGNISFFTDDGEFAEV